MQYLKITFAVSSQEIADVLMALLGDLGFEGFEEQQNELLAYIPERDFDKEALDETIASFATPYHIVIIPAQNWNALWESNFQPVIVQDFCTIRAHFHDITVVTPYDIQITPKMSFGTGHHATTQQMMIQMKDISFAGQSVLDFGTGTGVLAILAELLGAHDILAIDTDEWSVENALENVGSNDCARIMVRQGSMEVTEGLEWNIILANINRHILLQYMINMYARLKPHGLLLMSGLLNDDEEIIRSAADQQGFIFLKGTQNKSWISLLFCKS